MTDISEDNTGEAGLLTASVASVNHLEIPAELTFVLGKVEDGEWERKEEAR